MIDIRSRLCGYCYNISVVFQSKRQGQRYIGCPLSIVGQKRAVNSFFDLRTMANRNMRRPFIVSPVSRDISNTRVTWGNPPGGTPQHYLTTIGLPRQGRVGANACGSSRNESFPAPGARENTCRERWEEQKGGDALLYDKMYMTFQSNT